MALVNGKKVTSDTLVHIFFLICIVALTASFLFLLGEVKKVKDNKITTQDGANTIAQQVDLNEIKDYVTQVVVSVLKSQTPTPVATQTPTPGKVVTATSSVKKTAYLNLNGTFTTTNTDWVDIAGTDTPINLETEYGKDSYVDWDASIKISSSGSKVFVRLYDTTNKIAVNGSELESNNTIGVRTASGRLYFWRGQNVYRVQIKSLNGAEATFNGGRVKIVY
ncbi:MAG: hypothetical protein HYV90_04895 [Candidatus Woesebacteria bacterium]|nr:MAG: hypothetical protein HYV90_04895 [Candidatus Woesebacteria bacterium]